MNRENWSLFQKFVSSFMIVLTLIFVIMGAFYYWTSIRLAREDLQNEGTRLLEDVKDTVDSKIGTLLGLGIPLVTKDGVRDIEELTFPYPSDSCIDIRSIVDRLNAYVMMSDFSDGMILYYKQNNLFISDKTAGMYPQVFFSSWMNYHDLTYQEWTTLIN